MYNKRIDELKTEQKELNAYIARAEWDALSEREARDLLSECTDELIMLFCMGYYGSEEARYIVRR